MRIFRGLENIHSVIDRHEAEWRKEQGENPKLHDPLTIEETVRRRLTAQNDEGSGRFSADRFLGIKSKPAGKNSDTPVQTKPEPKPEPEAVEVIKNKDGRHSWLYNEVMKAINDAAKDNKNTKIIAVFVPVVQNGKEFEDLPADQIITTQPVNEDDVKLEPELPEQKQEQEQQNENDFNLLPEGQSEPDAELAEAFMTMEEKLDEAIAESNSEPETEAPQEELNEPEAEAPVEPETLQEEITEPEAELPVEPESIQEELTEPEAEAPVEPETIQEEITEPELEAPIEPEPEPEQEQENEIIISESHDENEFDSVPEIPEAADEAVDGEPLAFEEIDGESELAMPEMLDDDEVADDTFDESLTEVQRPDDDDDETIIIEDVDEPVEIIPDPEKKE